MENEKSSIEQQIESENRQREVKAQQAAQADFKPSDSLQWVITDEKTTTFEVEQKPITGKSSIYDLADSLGSKTQTQTTTTSYNLSATQQELLQKGVMLANEIEPSKQPTLPQQEQEQEHEARHMRDGERVQGSIKDTIEQNGQMFYVVENTTRDREIENVCIPKGEREHQIGDKIAAELINGEVYTVDRSRGLER